MINRSKITNFIKTSISTSPAGSTRATSLASMGDAYMYTEINSTSFGPNVYCSFERTDIVQISKVFF